MLTLLGAVQLLGALGVGGFECSELGRKLVDPALLGFKPERSVVPQDRAALKSGVMRRSAVWAGAAAGAGVGCHGWPFAARHSSPNSLDSSPHNLASPSM